MTADLVLSMRKTESAEIVEPQAAPSDATATAVGEALKVGALTPTHVYLQVVRSFLCHHWDASDLNIAEIGAEDSTSTRAAAL